MTDYPWWVELFLVIGIVVSLSWCLIISLILLDEFKRRARSKP